MIERENERHNHSHCENNAHNNCHCHCQCMSHIDKKEDSNSRKTAFVEKFIFIPMIIVKILISAYFYEKYFCYGFKNKLDIEYTKNFMTYFIIYLLILYLVAITSSSYQTNIDKYTPLNLNPNSKRELIEFKLSYYFCMFCKSAKLTRTSHCRICQKCSSFRDHHCPFTANCIGFNNIQYFLNFCFWGMYGIVQVIISYFSFHFINLSIYLRIGFAIDFIANIIFLVILLGIVIRNILSIYNNRTFIEETRDIKLEDKCPIIDCFKERNKSKNNNLYNIGFLNHFFYLLGPTLLHFLLPLPKFQNHIIVENCPVFCKVKMPNTMQIIQYNLKHNTTCCR